MSEQEEQGGIKTLTISISEQQLTDRIEIVHAGDAEIMQVIEGEFYDYRFKVRIEEISSTGILQTCQCCSDVDELLYTQLDYTIPENKMEWNPEYLDYLATCVSGRPSYKYRNEAKRIQEIHKKYGNNLQKYPTTSALQHITSIANHLGKNLMYHADNWISTLETTQNGGKTYATLVNELFGWTSRIPTRMINCWIRGDTIFVFQRGHEVNMVDLSEFKTSVPTITRKIVRTTWGSDVWSKTRTATTKKYWDEFDEEPYTPENGVAEMDDDGLIERKEVTHGDEKTVTTYEYETDGSGGKYLKTEREVHYINGSKSDEKITTHERVNMTQSHAVETDENGILGTSLTTSKFEDRATPYERGRGRSSGGIVVSDSEGNYYLLHGISRHADDIDMYTSTIHGISLIDTSFPIYGDEMLGRLTQEIMALNRKVEETVSLDVYGMEHIIDFADRVLYDGNEYFLRSNRVLKNERIVNKQSLELVRWTA